MGSAAVRAIIVWLLALLLNVRYLKEGAGLLSGWGPLCSRHAGSQFKDAIVWFQMRFLSHVYSVVLIFGSDLALVVPLGLYLTRRSLTSATFWLLSCHIVGFLAFLCVAS